MAETEFSQGKVLGAANVGGTQRLASVFVRAMLAANDRLTFVTGAHADAWHSASLSSPFSQTKGAFNPRLSVAYRFGESGVAVRGGVAGGFRAPTLNELYRRTQRGNDVTLANEALTPEHLRMADAGVVFSRGRAGARVTGFWSVLDDTVTNVTVSTSPSLNSRQRQNAGSMRSTGVEFEADVRLPHSWTAAFTASIIDARFSGSTRLSGYRVPQVAKYSAGADVRVNTGVWTASSQVRITGPQFDDDVNTRVLKRAAVVDLFAGRTLVRRLMMFVAIENLFDTDYEVGRIPIRTLGLPRAVRGGVQILFP
jgi:outer membrane receptor protein involved in Fe transport